jgi:hypothetical protein
MIATTQAIDPSAGSAGSASAAMRRPATSFPYRAGFAIIPIF